MDGCCLTRCYLESLTTQELTALADNLEIDIPPGLDRLFIIEELLETEKDGEDDVEGERAPPLEEADYLDPVPLPKQYNITYIKALIRDPLWVFVFWEIKSYDKEIYEKDQDFEGYYLKVSPVAVGFSGLEPQSPEKNAALSFTVPVEPDDTAWYLGFPPDYLGKETAGEEWFRVELCVRWGTESVVLAVSRPFKLPSLLPPADVKTIRSPLVDLSAVDELPVLRSGDRKSRILRAVYQ
jgi:hypothetical protein